MRKKLKIARLSALLVALLAGSASALAGYASQLAVPGLVSQAGGGLTLARNAAWANGAVQTVGTVGGLAANASSVAGVALQLVPTASAAVTIAEAAFALNPLVGGGLLVGAGVLAWLAQNGITPDSNGHWSKLAPATNMLWGAGLGSGCNFTYTCTSLESAITELTSFLSPQRGPGFGTSGTVCDSSNVCVVSYHQPASPGFGVYDTTYTVRGHVNTNPVPVARPAVIADFDAAAVDQTHPLTDPALHDSPVPVPVAAPQIKPTFIPSTGAYPCSSTASKLCQDGYQVAPDTLAPPLGVIVSPVVQDPNAVPAPGAVDPAATPDTKTCGLPGAPECNVKVDEAGTPQTADDPSKKIDDAAGDLKKVASDPESFFPKFPTLNWSFSVPSTCGVIPLAAFHEFLPDGIDVCQFKPIFDDLMSVVWLFGGIFGAIQLFLRDSLAA